MYVRPVVRWWGTSVREADDAAAAGGTGTAAGARGGAVVAEAAAAAGVLVDEDLPATALHAAERLVTSVHVDVIVLGEILVAQEAALEEGAGSARGGRRRRRPRGGRGGGLGAMEGGLADDLGPDAAALGCL